MKAGIAAIAMLGVLVTGSSIAAPTKPDSGNDMLEGCTEFLKPNTNPNSYFKAGICAGFIAGVSNTLVYARLSSPTTVPICIPDGFTVGQGTRVFLKYLDDHPETLHTEATVLAITAFRLAYPCK